MPTARAWLGADEPSPDEPAHRDAMGFMRECAVIAVSLLGDAAPTAGTEGEIGRAVRAEVEELLANGLAAAQPDVRFQSAVALSDLVGARAETRLCDALRDEPDPRVRESLIRALGTLEPPSAQTCDLLATLVDADEYVEDGAGFEAAVALAAARRHEGIPRLIEALAERPRRDRALETLAALGPAAVPAAGPIRRLAHGWFTPPVTRVRAAYALARVVPKEGLPLLDRMGRSLRPITRSAVRDARRALDSLADRERDPSSDP